FPSPTPFDGECVVVNDVAGLPAARQADITVTDATGLIDHCTNTITPAAADAPLEIDNPDGNEYVLSLTWAGLCPLTGEFFLRPSGDGFDLVVTRVNSDVICDGVRVKQDVRLYLTEPISTSAVI